MSFYERESWQGFKPNVILKYLRDCVPSNSVALFENLGAVPVSQSSKALC